MPDPLTLSQAEIDTYSIVHYLQSSLADLDWLTVTVTDVANGWPVYEELKVPGIYVELGDSRAQAPFELGSLAKYRTVTVFIFGQNEPQRIRLADTIEDLFSEDAIPIYDYVTGNEDDVDLTVVDHFVTDEVGWRKLPSFNDTPDKERWRALVRAELRRVTA